MFGSDITSALTELIDRLLATARIKLLVSVAFRPRALSPLSSKAIN